MRSRPQMLGRHEAGAPVWQGVARVGPQAFHQLVEQLRAAGGLMNDDVTLLVTRLVRDAGEDGMGMAGVHDA